MERWLFTFFIGAITALFLPVTPSSYYVIFLLLLAMGLLLITRYRWASGFFFGCCYLFFAEVDYQHAWLAAEQRLSENSSGDGQRIFQLHQQAHLVTGFVDNIPHVTLTEQTAEKPKSTVIINQSSPKQVINQRFNFVITAVDSTPLEQPVKVRLRWQQNAQLAKRVTQGQVWQLFVKIKPAHGFANKGSFSYQTWLRQKHIHGTGYVKPDKQPSSYAKTAGLKDSVGKQRQKASLNHLIEDRATVRARWYDKYQQQPTAQRQLGGLLTALAFGERSGISQQQWQVLTATGTQHLMAISGLHIGLVAGFSYLFAWYLLRLIPIAKFREFKNSRDNLPDRAFNNLPIVAFALKRNYLLFPIVFSAIVSFIYAYLAGFSLPTIRALIMLVIFAISRLMAIKLSLTTLMLLTVFFIIVITPFSLISMSFWLSFYAVSCIFFAFWRFVSWLNHANVIDNDESQNSAKSIANTSILTRRLWKFLKTLFLLQLVLSVCMLPIVAMSAGQLSSDAFFANIVAVPWMSFTVIPLNLLATVASGFSTTIAEQLLNVSYQLFEVLWLLLQTLAGFEWSLVALSKLQVTNLTVLFIALIVLPIAKQLLSNNLHCSRVQLAERSSTSTSTRLKSSILSTFQVNKRHFSFGLLAILLTSTMVFIQTSIVLASNQTRHQQNSLDSGKWQLTMFDVGHGLALLIEKNGKAILYDTGASYPSGFNIAEAVILPYLQSTGIKQIDKVIVSHLDNDHVGSLQHLLASITVGEVMSNNLPIANQRVQPCAVGGDFQWQGLTFKILSPVPVEKAKHVIQPAVVKQQASKNDSSCVIKVSATDGTSILLTGDITKSVEHQLVQSASEEPSVSLKSSVLVVPHHGSKTSSSLAFLEHVAPKVALVSAAKNHHWRLPNSKVSEQYKDQGIALINTANSGMIQVKFDQQSNWQIVTQRNELFPFWFAN